MDIRKITLILLLLCGLGFAASKTKHGADVELTADGAKLILNNNSQTTSFAASASTSESVDYKWPAADGNPSQALITDGSGALSFVDVNAVAGTHKLLSVTHTDAIGIPSGDVVRGSIIYGNSTPKWDELGLGAVNTFLGSDGTDLSYRTAAQVMASLSGSAAAAFDLNGQDLTNGGVLFLTEQAAAEADVAGKGQFWVKDTSPNQPYFTDDTGVDHQLRAAAISQTVTLLAADSTAQKQAKIDAVPRYIPFGITVVFQFETGNTHTETTILSWIGFYGGGIIYIQGNTGEANATALHTTQDTIIDFTTNAVNGIDITICRVNVFVINLKIIIQDVVGLIALASQSCFGRTFFAYNYILGETGSNKTFGVLGNNSFGFIVKETYFSTLRYGITSNQSMGLSYENDDTGTQPVNGLYAYNSGVIGKRSTQPTGSTANEVVEFGGVIR